jgi:single-stranded DNA-binding protein
VPAGPETIFIGAAAFDRVAAERLASLSKGSPIATAGELQPNNWTDREGVEHRDWRLLVSEILTVSQAARRRKATAAAS